MTPRSRQLAVSGIACALTLSAADAALADPPPPNATATPAAAPPTTGSGAVVVVGSGSPETVPTDGTAVGATTGTVATGSTTTATAGGAATPAAGAQGGGDAATATATATDPQASHTSGSASASASTGATTATSAASVTVSRAQVTAPGAGSPIVIVRGGVSISRATRHGKQTRSGNIVCITGQQSTGRPCRRRRGDPPAVAIAGGRVTVDSVTASTRAVAVPGRAPKQRAGMSVRHLKVRHSGHVMFDVVSASMKTGSHPTCADAPVRRGTLCATVEVHGPDGLTTTSTLVIRRGADLMDPRTYHRNRSLRRAFRTLRHQLAKVSAPNGPLPGLSIRLAVGQRGTFRTSAGRRRAYVRITAVEVRFRTRVSGTRAQAALPGLASIFVAASKSAANVGGKLIQTGKSVAHVIVPSPPVTPASSAPPPPPPPPPIAKLSVPARGLRAPHGILRLEFTCAVSVQGRLVLTDTAGRPAAAPATLSCTPGTTARLRFKLSRSLRAQLAAGRAVTIQARLLLGSPPAAALSTPVPLVIRPGR